jgi:hypothetical protein
MTPAPVVRSPKRRGISVADLEKVMGRKADVIGPYVFDPESMSWGRTITFKLKSPYRQPRKRSRET